MGSALKHLQVLLHVAPNQVPRFLVAILRSEGVLGEYALEGCLDDVTNTIIVVKPCVLQLPNQLGSALRRFSLTPESQDQS